MAISYDSLELNISANVSEATKGIRSLKSSLKALQDTVKGLDFETLTRVEKHLQNIAKIDFSNVSKGLQDVVSAFKQMNSLANGKVKMPVLDPKEQAKAINLMTNFGEGFKNEPELPKIKFEESSLPTLSNGFSNTFKDYKVSIEEVNNAMLTLNNSLKQAGLNGAQVEAVVRALEYESNEFDPAQLEIVEETLKKFGIDADKAKDAIKRLKKETKEGGKDAEKSAGKFQKIANAFKRILFYRMVRRAIQLVGQALKQGIENVALFDSEFNASMSELKSSLSYLKNAIGTTLAPLIEYLAPIATTLIDGLAEAFNGLSEAMSSFAGKDYFISAKKSVEDYADSIKKNKNISLGIDELNVVKQDDDQNLEKKAVQANNLNNSLKEFGANIKAILSEVAGFITTNINKVFGLVQKWIPKVLEWLNPILAKIGQIFDAIQPIVDMVFEIIDQLFNQTNDTVGESVGAFVDTIIDIVNLIAQIIKMLKPVFETINLISSLIVNVVNNGLTTLSHVINTIVKNISPILKILEPILDVIMMIVDVIVGVLGGAIEAIFGVINTLVEFIVAIFDTLVAVFQGDFNKIGDIWGKLGERMKNIWRSVGNFFIDVLNALIGAVEKFANFFVDIAGKVASWFGADTSNWGVHINKIEHFATGGFPSEDGFFYANHNELVGQFSNGRTAVANNEQITEGIYQAVLQAMNDSNRQSDSRDIVLQIDGREIGRASEKYQTQKGAPIFSGGYHYGY